jgi:chanoclavine-I dehydrogenase
MLPGFFQADKYEAIRSQKDRHGMRLIGPEDVARIIVHLLSEDSAPVNGANLVVGEGQP